MLYHDLKQNTTPFTIVGEHRILIIQAKGRGEQMHYAETMLQYDGGTPDTRKRKITIRQCGT